MENEVWSKKWHEWSPNNSKCKLGGKWKCNQTNKNGKTDLKEIKSLKLLSCLKYVILPKKYVVKSQYRRISKPNISLVCASAFYQVKWTSVSNYVISSSVNQDWRVTMQVILRWAWREELTMKLPTPWTTFYLFIMSTVFKYYVFMYASNWRTTGLLLLLLLSLLLYLKWRVLSPHCRGEIKTSTPIVKADTLVVNTKHLGKDLAWWATFLSRRYICKEEMLSSISIFPSHLCPGKKILMEWRVSAV